MHNVERNVVYGMYSGLALLMDVYHPEESNRHGIVYMPGEGNPDDQDPINRESARVQCVVARAAPVDLVRMGERSPTISSFIGMIVRGEAGGPRGRAADLSRRITT